MKKILGLVALVLFVVGVLIPMPDLTMILRLPFGVLFEEYVSGTAIFWSIVTILVMAAAVVDNILGLRNGRSLKRTAILQIAIIPLTLAVLAALFEASFWLFLPAVFKVFPFYLIAAAAVLNWLASIKTDEELRAMKGIKNFQKLENVKAVNELEKIIKR